MTRGQWLTSLARPLFHRETFELVVSPAIADLQFEPPSSRGYAAVWIALGGAAWRDLRSDLRILSDDVGTLGVLVAMQACYYTCLLTLMSGLTTSGLTAVDAFARLRDGAALFFVVLITGLSDGTQSGWRSNENSDPAKPLKFQPWAAVGLSFLRERLHKTGTLPFIQAFQTPHRWMFSR
jgi:hypothetical protein